MKGRFHVKSCPNLNKANHVNFTIITNINIKMSADTRPDKELTNALSQSARINALPQ